MASFEKRGKTWRYQIHHQRNGQKQRISKSGFKTRKEAQIAAMEVEQKLNKGITVFTEDPLLTDYLRNWFEVYKVSDITKVTESRYRTFQILHTKKETYVSTTKQQIQKNGHSSPTNCEAI